MHSEYYMVTPEAADRLNAARQRGGRIVCVGTTSVRTLETVAAEDGVVHPGSGWTQIFIMPGYRYKAVDALITNFHLPESTLLMLVSAFMGRENALHMYETAVQMRYRFFSFGDATLLLLRKRRAPPPAPAERALLFLCASAALTASAAATVANRFKSASVPIAPVSAEQSLPCTSDRFARFAECGLFLQKWRFPPP